MIKFLTIFLLIPVFGFAQNISTWNDSGTNSSPEDSTTTEQYKSFLASQRISVVKTLDSFPDDVIGGVEYFHSSKTLSPDFSKKNDRKRVAIFTEKEFSISLAGQIISFDAQAIFIGQSETQEQQLIFFTNTFIGYLKKYKTQDGFSFNVLLLVFSKEENLYIFY